MPRKGKTEGVSQAYIRRKSRCQGPGAGTSLICCQEQTGGLLGTAAPYSGSQRSGCALRSLTSPEGSGARWAGEAGEGCPQRTTRRGGEQGDRLGGQPRKSTAGRAGGELAAGSQDDGEGGACGCSLRAGGELGTERRRAGKNAAAVSCNRAAQRGAGSHSGHLPNTCAVRKTPIHDVVITRWV